MTARRVRLLAFLTLAASGGILRGAERTLLSFPVRLEDVKVSEAEAVTLDLPAVLGRAGRDNLDLRIARSDADAAEGERQRAAGRWWPDLGVGALARHTDGTVQGTFGELGRTVFGTALLNAIVRWDLNPGATFYRSRAARSEAGAAQASVEVTQQRSLLAAATRYIELAGAVVFVTVARQTHGDALEFLRLTTTLEQKGLGPGVDVQLARAEAARREEALAVTQRTFRVASARLAASLNLDPAVLILPAEATIDPVDLPEREEVGALVARALAGRPEVQAAGREVAAAESRVAALRWEAYGPGVTVEAQQGYLGTDFDDVFERSIYGAQIGWTFRPDQIGAVRAARARLQAARLDQERVSERIRAEVVLALEEVELSRRRQGIARRMLEAGEEALHISQVRFARGLGNSLEVLRAQDSVAAARAEAVTALVEARRSLFELRQALGERIDVP